VFPEMAQLQFKQPEPTPITDPGKSFQFDFTSGDFVLSDGKVVVIDELAALKVWVEKIIRTERFRYRLYARDDGNEYGITLADLIGTVLPSAFVEAELKREIKEALTRHPRIAGVSNLSTIRDDARITISFSLNLSDNQVLAQEVNIVG